MKKFKLLSLFAMTMMIASCSDNNEPETESEANTGNGTVTAAQVVPGTYSGYTEASSKYFSGMMADNQEIVITKNSDESYKVAYSSDSWGDFTIEKATAQYADGKFNISGEGTTQMGMNGNVNNYPCTLSGSIDTDKKDPTFTFSIPAVMGGTTIVFHTGEMPATEEAE